MSFNELTLKDFVEQIENGVCSTKDEFALALSKLSTSDRRSLAQLPDYFYSTNLPLELQKLLAKDKIWFVRLDLAYNKHVSPEVLEELSKSKGIQILSGVAENPNTSLKVLEELSLNKKLRPHLARNPSLSSQLFEELYKDKDCVWYIMVNHNAPQHLLRDIWSKRESLDYFHIEALFINRNLPYDVFKSMGEYRGLVDKRLLYQNPSCPPDLLSEWSKKPDSHVSKIISNPNIPAERLYHFSKNSDDFLRQAVVENVKCPKDILLVLSKDNRPNVSELAKKALIERDFPEEENTIKEKTSMDRSTSKENKQFVKPNPYLPKEKNKKGWKI